MVSKDVMQHKGLVLICMQSSIQAGKKSKREAKELNQEIYQNHPIVWHNSDRDVHWLRSTWIKQTEQGSTGADE